jgi:hypothetical protein
VETLYLGLLAAVSGGLAVWLFGRARTGAALRRAARAGYFDAARAGFAGVTTGRAPDGFARLNGRRGGRLFDLQAVPDTLTFRKLPALWLLVSLPEPMPVGATLDILMRPTGNEPFSRFRDLPRSLEPPAGAPGGLAMRCDDPSGLPSGALILRHLSLFGDPRLKELVLSPRGLRAVWLAEEAERTRYLLFRDSEMGRAPVDAATVTRLADALAALADDLEAEARPSNTRAP